MTLASPVVSVKDATSTQALPLPSKTIFQFPSVGYWAENIAVRPNGNLLVTLLSPKPELWQIAEPYSDAPNATLVYAFPDATGLLGITETAADTFVVAAQNFTPPTVAAAWEVAFGKDGEIATRKVANIPSPGVLNGATTVPGCGSAAPSAVLIADSTRGLVFRVDTKTGAVETAAQFPEMAPVNSTSVGINGIKIRDDYLYFDNSYAATLYRVKITPSGFAVAGATVETVAKISAENFLDDFIFDGDGAIWIASNHGRTVYRVDVQTGDSVVVAGAADQNIVVGDTAAAFGRSREDNLVLYVTTSGFGYNGSNVPVEPGKIVAIEAAGFR